MQRRWSGRTAAATLLLLVACQGPTGGYTAEAIPTPFPATLSDFRIAHFHTCDAGGCSYPPERHCDDYGCVIALVIRITNPTDHDPAYAMECDAVVVLGGSTRHAKFFAPGGPAGLAVPAGKTRRVDGVTSIKLTYAEIARLPQTVKATCRAVDWHGHEPP